MIYLIVFVLLLATELGYFRLAERLNIIDKPNERSSHTRITLRGGGIIFYFGVLLYFFLSRFNYPWFLIGLTLIAIISFADDNKHQTPAKRLTVQFVAMIMIFYQWGLFDLPWYFTLISIIVCTGILNAYNFMDGINGITGGYSMVTIGALWYINSYQVAFVDNNLLYVLMLSLLIFNFFNFRKNARCFAGDVGAMSIAFIIVFLLGLLIIKTGNLSYILLLALYGVDSILTIIHRIMLHENIFTPHRKHLFQIMANELKIPQVAVALIYMVLQVLISAGLIMTSYKYWYSLLIILLFCAIYILFMKIYFNLHQNAKKLI